MPLVQMCLQCKLSHAGSSLWVELGTVGFHQGMRLQAQQGHRLTPVRLAHMASVCLFTQHAFVPGRRWIKAPIQSKGDWDIPVYSCLIALHGLEQQLEQAQTSKPWQGMLPTSSRWSQQAFHSTHLFWGEMKHLGQGMLLIGRTCAAKPCNMLLVTC